MWGFFIAILSGALMSVQGIFNTSLTKSSSLWVAAGFVQLTGFLTCVLCWLWQGREKVSMLWNAEPKYMLTGGILGALITITVVKSVGSMGPAKAALCIVASQILVAWLIELFGWFGVEQTAFVWKRLIGMLTAIAGIVIFYWGK